MDNRFNLTLTSNARERIVQRQKDCEKHFKQNTIVAIVCLEKELNFHLKRDGIGLAFYYDSRREEIQADLIHASEIEPILSVPKTTEEIFQNRNIDLNDAGFFLV